MDEVVSCICTLLATEKTQALLTSVLGNTTEIAHLREQLAEKSSYLKATVDDLRDETAKYDALREAVRWVFEWNELRADRNIAYAPPEHAAALRAAMEGKP
jgi:hypothetical protein